MRFHSTPHINFLQVGMHIIMPSFGFKEDSIALNYIRESFRDYEIHPLGMTEIAREGGALHCISWNTRR